MLPYLFQLVSFTDNHIEQTHLAYLSIDPYGLNMSPIWVPTVNPKQLVKDTGQHFHDVLLAILFFAGKIWQSLDPQVGVLKPGEYTAVVFFKTYSFLLAWKMVPYRCFFGRQI